MAGPKLLDKKIVNATVATQQKQQIDAGLLLAKKVDAVRETLQDEQQRLDEFRKETIARTHFEIDVLIKRKEGLSKQAYELEKEVELLKERKSIELLGLPIDEQWKRVEAMFTKHDKKVQELEIERAEVKQRLEQLTHDMQTVEAQKQRNADIQRIVSEELAQADSTLKNAHESAAEIRNKSQVVLFAAELREKEVKIKEDEIEQRELEVAKELERLTALETDIENRERVLKDRYATLARTLNRIKE